MKSAIMQPIDNDHLSSQVILQQEVVVSVLDLISDMVWEIDNRFVFVYVSPKTEVMMGYRLDELIGKTPFDFMMQDEAEKNKQHLLPIFSNRTAFSSVELVLVKKDGEEIVVEMSGVPVFDNKGSFWGYRGVQRDVMHHKRLEAANRDAVIEIEAKNILLQELKAALNVVLRQRDDAADEMKLTILNNLRLFVMPHLESIERGVTTERIKRLINLTKRNLAQIATQFFRRTNSLNGLLSPMETQIATMVKDGMSTKEIANILNVSVRTISSHRYNIRKKFQINDKKASLPAFLLSLE